MSSTAATPDIPSHPAERRAWIHYQLRLRGLTFRAVARALGVSHQAVSLAALGTPSARIEAALAKAISVPPARLFPEHYAANGRRIPVAMATSRKGTRQAGAVHAGKSEAA